MSDNFKNMAPTDLIVRYFANEASEFERAQVEHWRDKSEANIKEFEALERLWKITSNKPQEVSIDLNKEWVKMEKHIDKKQTPVFTLKRVLQMAAMIIVIVGFGYLFMQQNDQLSKKTKIAEVKTTYLPDGSEVTLNANSKIFYDEDFGKTNRNIALKGEAFFSVEKNKELPFEIEVAGAGIRVLGTEFNVSAYKEYAEVKVSVLEGKVQLFDQKKPEMQVQLVAGETGFYGKKKRYLKKMPHFNNNDLSYKTKHLSFNNTTLDSAVVIIENTYHIEVELDNNVKDCKLTVEFKNTDIGSVLKVLKSTLNLEMRIEKNTVYISGEGCE